jgi:flavin reductase (DIM6/NTAB) family NADH-FMN oxidoreductase RutF
MSSAWWLGWRCPLGLAASSKTTENLRRTGECVLNLPSVERVSAVDRIARTTGSDPVPVGKRSRGYEHERDKFARAGLTPVPSTAVAAPRAAECPIQLEAGVSAIHPLASDDARFGGFALAIEVAVERLHVDESVLMDGNPDPIDPAKWRPLIMSFQRSTSSRRPDCIPRGWARSRSGSTHAPAPGDLDPAGYCLRAMASASSCLVMLDRPCTSSSFARR